MTQSSRSRQGRCLIALVGLVYGALLVMASGCAFAHTDGSQGHHSHHEGQGSSSQNVLCAWVCQAASDCGAVAQPFVAGAWVTIGLQFFVSESYSASSVSATLYPRAPPGALFLSRG